MRAGLAGLVVLVIATAPARGDKPGEKAISNSLGMRLVRIPAGEFRMGSRDSAASLARAYPGYEAWRIERITGETPPHTVRITRPFYLGAHEVTVGQFRRFVADARFVTEPERDGTGGWGFDPDRHDIIGRRPQYSWKNTGFPQDDDHPVVNITWHDAVAFCRWLGRKEGGTYRLPTEAEWEYACRAGTETRYNFGDDPGGLPENANTFDASGRAAFPDYADRAVKGDDGFEFTAPVGRFKPNAWGLYDMHGNAWEWCSDWYGEDYYANSPRDDPQGPPDGKVRVRRGGAWHSWPLYTRTSFRNYNTMRSRYPNLGLRVVLETPR